MTRPVYLDCNATGPVDARVLDEVVRYLAEDYGNAGSRTHAYGQAAKERVNRSRRQVATLVGCEPDEVVFTSGATESDNLAVLGLAPHALSTGRTHIVSTQIEHKAVLAPLERLAGTGFEVTLVGPEPGGWVDPEAIRAALRPDTGLVSVMAVNNETGVEQPIDLIAEALRDHDAYLHVDAAQSFGKIVEPLRNNRIDLIAASGHKLFAPKGVGVLITRRREYEQVPLTALMVGGGQERGIRPGTLPVHLVAGIGTAAEIAHHEHALWAEVNRNTKRQLVAALDHLGVVHNGDVGRTVDWTVNFSVPGVDSEAAIVALKDVVAVSNGSACTSSSYEPSHVLVAAGLSDGQVAGALRLSWSHLTGEVPVGQIVARLDRLRR
jgi:cysteine desulfurase